MKRDILATKEGLSWAYDVKYWNGIGTEEIRIRG